MRRQPYKIPPEYRNNFAAALLDDPGICPARSDSERYYPHSFVPMEGGGSICEWCGKVEE